VPDVADDDALDAALDELYGVDPSEFVAVRKQLATRLRGAGHPDAAKVLQGARRPTKAASIVNQLARRRPDLVEALLDRSRELRAAQTRAISGRPDALRDATHAQREAMAAARDTAVELAGPDATESVRTQISETLLGASANDEAGEELRRGRLTHELRASGGFPESGGLRVVPPSPPTRAAPRRAKPTPAEAERERAQRGRRERAEADLGSARSALRAAQHDVRRAEAASARADDRVEQLRSELETARETSRSARRALVDAQRRVHELERAVKRLSDALRKELRET
jgi:hypothetical protein